ncbi:MAG: hypothetical protein R3208_02825 [Ketobacteraceae bacterium]|nr:hypothetical protein [Ketobacteraceae bacterium]
MVNPILKSVLAVLTCIMAGTCFAQDMSDVSFGNCGFAGPEFMTSDYNCHQIQQRSDNGVKKEALLHLASMAWDLITGDTEEKDTAENFGVEQASLNEGQKLEPRFSLSAESDELYLTVSYEF